MAVKRDYKCPKHGFFEAWEAICPNGCTAGIKVAFLKAPAIKSEPTKNIDSTTRGLASDFKMTNMKSTREGEAQDNYASRNNTSSEPRPGDSVIWGGNRNHSMQSVLNGSIRSVRGESVGLNPRDIGNLNGPKAASYIADHEGLKVPA